MPAAGFQLRLPNLQCH